VCLLSDNRVPLIGTQSVSGLTRWGIAGHGILMKKSKITTYVRRKACDCERWWLDSLRIFGVILRLSVDQTFSRLVGPTNRRHPAHSYCSNPWAQTFCRLPRPQILCQAR
jgi:hypothetical protein